jgi:hypothetical protein
MIAVLQVVSSATGVIGVKIMAVSNNLMGPNINSVSVNPLQGLNGCPAEFSRAGN